MRVLALSFVDTDFTTPGAYREYLLQKVGALVGDGQECLLVLPSLTGLYFAYLFGDLGDVSSLNEAVRAFLALPVSWHHELVALHREVAQNFGIWLVTGGTLVRENNHIYHEALLLSPEGDVVGRQRQVYLSRQEKEWGLTRGEDLHVFTVGEYKVGILIGTDAWYPETGRILALQGADLVCHCGALLQGDNHWLQLAGMWQQVQQNQFFCVESQLCSMIAGVEFFATTRVLAPCEMTPEMTGVVVAETPGSGMLGVVLDHVARINVIASYPLLNLLHPIAYGTLACPEGDVL